MKTQTLNDAGTETATTVLTWLDRCDNCGARAYHRVSLTTGKLYFCNHHATKYKDRLKVHAVDWVDESQVLLDSVKR